LRGSSSGCLHRSLMSWAALYLGGFHPALALVPIVPFMPHGPADLGLFDPREAARPDTLNRVEHWWATPVQFVLLLFGFANAGVPFEQIGPGTYYVLAGLLLGKPVGILLFANVARRRREPATRTSRRRSPDRGSCSLDWVYRRVVLRDGCFSGWHGAGRNEDGHSSVSCGASCRDCRPPRGCLTPPAND
jgi:hypothetical protein